jgi:hypothetical protein
MRKILPILLLVIGLAAGAGAGWFLRPAADPVAAGTHGATGDAQDAAVHQDAAATAGHGENVSQYQPAPSDSETVRLANQFVVPLIEDGRVRAMVVIGLALELTPGHQYSPANDEPRLRAVFLQLLFDHANIGGFDGIFTSGEALLALRRTLVEAARVEVGAEVHDVLITELLRQES